MTFVGHCVWWSSHAITGRTYIMPSPLRIHGLVAATLTAFNGTGGLDLSVVPQQQAYLKSTGVNWTFVSGTTGESLSLTINE